jgi:aminopeptidase N
VPTVRAAAAAAAVLAVLALAACSKPPAEEPAAPSLTEAPAPTDEPPAGRLPSGVEPIRYALDLRIDPQAESFSGTVAIDVAIESPHDKIWLHGLNLEVAEAYAETESGERVAAAYAQELPSGVASLTFEQTLPVGRTVLTIAYSAPYNRSVNALFRAERGGLAYVASQLEAVAGRQIFPGFDEPRFKTPWDVSITAPADAVAITNSPEDSATTLDDGWVRHQYVTSLPLPTYLLVFVVGPYDVVDGGVIAANLIRERTVPLRGVAPHGLGSRFGLSLRETPAVVGWLESYFGIAYPYAKLDLIAMPATFGGAMENAGGIAYDDTLILVGDDPPIDQRRAYLYVHAHELAHMWFGDLVTPEWWTDIWLNEAFATWMGNKAAAAVWPDGELDRATLTDAIEAMAQDALASTRQIHEPVLRNEEIEDSFDSITYEKGGAVLDMFENYLGEDGFRAGVRLHMGRFAHSVANADQFLASLAEGAGQPGVAAAFRTFLDQPGVPVVATTLTCAEDAAPRIELEQSRYAPLGSTIDAGTQQWQIPVCIAYDAADAPGDVCQLLDGRSATIELDLGACPSAIHPNSHGAGYYRFTLDEPGWQALIARAGSLEPAEALTLVDNLVAAFRAGTLSAENLVSGLTMLAGHPAWDVAVATVDGFAGLLDILDDDARAAAKAKLLDVYRPRYEALAGGDGESTRLLQRRLTRFLALGLDDAALRAELAAMAEAYIDADGTVHPDAAPADLVQTALTVGVQDLGEPFFDRVMAASLATEDPYFRDAAFGALGRVHDPALVDRLRAAVLEQQFPLMSATGMIGSQLADDATRDATWAWVQANADEVIMMVPEFFRSQVVPRLGVRFCSAERAAEVEEFVTGHAALLPGHERSLEQALEGIALCAALREAKGAELAAAFQ